jgi:hypothetical protein
MTDETDLPEARHPAHARRAARAVRRWRPLVGIALRRGGRILLSALELLLALIILFEEWGWRSLAELIGRLARWRPFAALEALIIRLPPYAALVVFALPTLVLLPLKFVALLLISGRHVVAAGVLFVAAKIFATALIARLYLLTRPALMRIGWFAAAHDTLTPWKEALVSRVHDSWLWRGGRRCTALVSLFFELQWLRWRPAVLALARRARAAFSGAARGAVGGLALGGRARLHAARRWLGRTMTR